MKEIRTEDAVGHILCHDITQIIKDEKKGVLFKKGHVVKEEDIPLLLSVGKEHLFVWEKKPGILHENEAAEILYKICAGNSSKVHGTEIKEGKIEVVSKIDGILKIRRDALVAVNSLGEMMIASRHGDFPIKKGDKVAKNCTAVDIAYTPADLCRLKKAGKKAVMLGIENGYAIGVKYEFGTKSGMDKVILN